MKGYFKGYLNKKDILKGIINIVYNESSVTTSQATK